jgi:hypothetical protein
MDAAGTDKKDALFDLRLGDPRVITRGNNEML